LLGKKMSRRKLMTARTKAILLVAAAAAIGLFAGGTVQSAPLAPTDTLRAQAGAASDVTDVAVVYRRGAAVGPRGGVYRYGGAAVVRPGYRYGGWARPGWYRWGPGGAIAAGAAIGFIAAAGAAAYATAPAPAPGMCWYYTDAYRRAGFWDYCP
jgi:hypothetical protein